MRRVRRVQDLAYCTDKVGTVDCTCFTGYEGDGTLCADVDECADDTHDCDVLPLPKRNVCGISPCFLVCTSACLRDCERDPTRR